MAHRKVKSHSGAKKRFSLTKTGKVKFKRAKMRHILAKKSHNMKRRLRMPGIMAEVDAKHVRQLLGQG